MMRYAVASVMGLAALAGPDGPGLSAQDHAAPGRMVDVGGYQLHLYCRGPRKPPTVVLDAGSGGWSVNWLPVQERLAQAGVTACAYDRAGTGLSAPGPEPRVSSVIVRELKALLSASDLPRPYVLVGHSFGGMNMRLYAGTHPGDVAGLVLVESGHEDQWTRFPPEALAAVEAQGVALNRLAAGLDAGEAEPPAPPLDPSLLTPEWARAVRAAYGRPQHYRAVASELAGITQSAEELKQVRTLGSLPLLVLTAGRSVEAFQGAGFDLAVAGRAWAELQRDLVELSTRSRQAVHPDATHRLYVTHPDFVVDQILTWMKEAALWGSELHGSHRASEFEDLLERLVDAYASGDAARFADLFAPDVEVRDLNRRQVIRGRAAWRELSQTVMNAHRWMTLAAEPVARTGPDAAVRLRWAGLLRGEVLGRSHDVEYAYEGVSLMRMEHGLIARHELFIDYATFLAQIGDVDAPRRAEAHESAWRDYVDAWASGDPDRILPYFDRHAVLLPAGAAILRGKAQFEEWLRDTLARGVRVFLESEEVRLYGTELVRRGSYRAQVEEEAGSRTGGFLQVWRLGEDARWRIVRGAFTQAGGG